MTLRFVLPTLIALLWGATFPFSLAFGQNSPADQNRDVSPSAAFYEPQVVQEIRLDIASEHRKKMHDALPKTVYVPATFRWRDLTVENVAVRFKGNSSSQPNQKHKRSYLVRFDKYNKAARFLGLQRISFDNGVQFGSLFSEVIITDILRREGVTTHRCNLAKIILNGEFHGVFVNVERIDDTFLSSRFQNADGPLYKVDLGGPGCDLRFIGNEPTAYQQAFEAKNDAATNRREELVDLIRLINHSDQPTFQQQFAQHFNVDDFIKTTSVMLLAGAFDQLTGWNAHNYYLYLDPSTGHWTYLPWDLDVGFCETAFGRIHVLRDWNATWPVPITGNGSPLLERIISQPELLKRYRNTTERILNAHFEPEKLCAQIDQKYALISNDLKKDPFPHRRVTVPTDRNYDDVVASLKEFVRKRFTSAQEQLQNPGPRPKPRRPESGERGMTPEIRAKIQEVHQGAEKIRRSNGDLRPLHEIMQHVGPLLEAGKNDEALNHLERALKIVRKRN